MKNPLSLAALIAGFISTNEAFAFRDHTLLAYYLFDKARSTEQFQALNSSVTAESLEAFLGEISKNKEQYDQLRTCLEQVEAYAKGKIPDYRPVPDKLKLPDSPDDLTPDDLKKTFIKAIRFNTAMDYVPDVRSFLLTMNSNSTLNGAKDTALSKEDGNSLGVSYSENRKILKDGDSLSSFEVLCSACDEPDYGYDQHLWQESADKEDPSGFGIQPFGNSQLSYATQGPFHMGFFHESWIINKLAPSFTKTYVEYRIKQCIELSKFAFRHKHNYWGWRFLGWGLHYVQDLCQPYHASMLPGTHTLKIVWAGIASKLGFNDLKDKYTTLASNLHRGFEIYLYGLLNMGLVPCDNQNGAALKGLVVKPAKSGCCSHHTPNSANHNPNSDDVVIRDSSGKVAGILDELRGSHGGAGIIEKPLEACQLPDIPLDDYPRQVISKYSYGLGPKLAAAMTVGLPTEFLDVENPRTSDELNHKILDIENLSTKACREVVGSILQNVAGYSRLFVSAVLREIEKK